MEKVKNDPSKIEDENVDCVEPRKRQKVSEPIVNCKFFVHRKKRFCKMTVKTGEELCGEHKKIVNIEPGSEISKNNPSRIICPLDGKHTCYAHNLKKHLKICNARPKSPKPFIVKGINSGDTAIEGGNTYRLLSSFSIADIVQTISKVNSVYNELIQAKLSQKYSSNKLLEDEMLNPDYGFKTKKHLKQVSSMLGLLSDYNLLKSSTCFIEFGAGKGQLSFWLAKTIGDIQESKVLLIERASPKHKKDNKLTKTSDNVCRIRADISDIVLDKLEIVNKSTHIVGLAKHLCGEATDLAIRCLENVKENKEKVLGCILSFCCHHRCRWVPYTGKEFFSEKGLDKNDFDIMCGMASWATCGTGLSRELQKEIDEKELKQNERDIGIGLTRLEKGEIGRKSKNVLNWGRLHYLEKCKLNCYLHYYVEPDITLENVCIIAIK